MKIIKIYSKEGLEKEIELKEVSYIKLDGKIIFTSNNNDFKKPCPRCSGNAGVGYRLEGCPTCKGLGFIKS